MAEPFSTLLRKVLKEAHAGTARSEIFVWGFCAVWRFGRKSGQKVSHLASIIAIIDAKSVNYSCFRVIIDRFLRPFAAAERPPPFCKYPMRFNGASGQSQEKTKKDVKSSVNSALLEVSAADLKPARIRPTS